MFLFGKYSARQHHRTLAGLDRGRQLALFLGEVLVHGCGAGAAFGDGPDHEALATAGIAAHEHAILGGGELVIASDVATLVEFDGQLVEDGLGVRMQEAHGDEDQIGGQHALGARLASERTSFRREPRRRPSSR